MLNCDASESELDGIRKLARTIEETADCAIGYHAASGVLASLELCADEYESHIKAQSCQSEIGQKLPCETLCPAHVDVPAYIACVAEEDYAGAIRVIRDDNPFPTACAFVCEHPCEARCRRAIIDSPINIRGVKLNPNPGMFATEVFHAASEGRIKGLFIFGEDQVRTDPDIHHVIDGLEALEFLVVDDLFLTETAKYADVVLPGRSYAEKEGTFSNTERRVQRVRKAVHVPGATKLDTDIFTEIMNRMGYPQPFLSSAEIMGEIASVTPSFAGISHERLDSDEVAGCGLQWPCTSQEHPGTPIMHVGRFTRGLAAFSTAQYKPSTELPDDEYPLMLTTGRILYHYNATAMTARTEGLNEIVGSSFIEVNDEDARRLGIEDGDRVRVSSRRGAIESTARVSAKTNVGQTWMPFHFQDGNANWLTIASFDTICACPEYKVCAIQLEKA